MTPVEQRTSALRASDRTRKKRSRRRSGKPGRKSQAQQDKSQAVVERYTGNPFNFFVNEDLPTLTPTQVRVVNCLMLPDTHCLTNKQVAGLLGIHPETVNGFRDSHLYYRAIAECTVFEKKLEVLEAQSMVALERNIVEDRDNAAIKMVLVMRQRLDEAHRNIFQITADTIQIGVGQTLANLPEAEFEVIAEGADEGSKEEKDVDR